MCRAIGVSDTEARLLRKQQGLCALCQGRLEVTDTFQVDHIIPKSNGGAKSRQNLQIMHTHCHHLKSAADLREKRRAKAP